MVDLKAKPFYLSDEAIRWVEETIASMSLEEKIGQLFVNIIHNRDEAVMLDILERYHIGATRYNPGTADEIYEQNRFMQAHSKIPLLIAANLESGGDGACSNGTMVGCPVSIGATGDPANAYAMGRIGAREAAAIGCNWTFAPIVDLTKNWRNCVISNRAYGADEDLVLAMSKEYMRGAAESGLACAMKHFPGDGMDERDHHILASVNEMTCADWDRTFGKVYAGMIEAGIPSVMAGHIKLPHYSRALCPGIRDADILPASLSHELLTGLLREKLGFNGLIVTDASHMVGLTSAMKRKDLVPATIAAGCDLFLFFRDPEEDFGAMLEGYKSGVLSEERLSDALHRILGLKAQLRLHEKQKSGALVPPREGLSIVGCAEHQQAAARVADEAVTLVKNTRDQLPIRPETHKRIMFYPLGEDLAFFQGTGGPSTMDVVEEELRAVGFEVTRYAPPARGDGKRLLAGSKASDFAKSFDAVMLFANIQEFSQSNVRRIHWSMPMGPDIPWYVMELPTVFVSLSNPFHLVDVPMVPTYINAYDTSRETIRQVIQKIMGESAFKGESTVDAFCGLWDTHL